jgi:very-short-patch-repair endonuclease
MSPTDRIRQLLHHKPGLKAQQIADELGLDRPHVAAALHNAPAGDLVQDAAYRWWPKAHQPAPADAAPRSFLARVCRYYLECLGRESGSAISLPAAGEDVDYVVLDELPFAHTGLTPPGPERAIKKLIRRVRQERQQLTLYIGYAVRLRPVIGPDRDEMRIEPVLLYPLEDTADHPADLLRPASGIPLFNLDALRTLLSADSGSLVDEAIHLSDELGLANPDDELPQWDEIVLRLRDCRPEWDWREDLNPYELSRGTPLRQLTTPGVYNRAVLFAASRSPFTYGLEVELRKLERLEDAALADTALGRWLHGGADEPPEIQDAPILEMLPLNGEQRQAVVQSMAAPLTVVTGPPGTGKSQVVVALLANMAWQGRSVLFASKNNHAVDVVESRANELGTHPLLLRLGKEEHHAALAQHLGSALAESSDAEQTAAYARLEREHERDRARYTAIQREIAAVVELRNRVDELERTSETARSAIGADRFPRMRAVHLEGIQARVDAFASALDQPAARLLPARRFKRVAEAAAALVADAELLGLRPPAADVDEENVAAWEAFHRELKARLDLARLAGAYWDGFERLRNAPALEDLGARLNRVSEESAHTSLELWRRWIRLWPSRWDPADRKLLSEYVSLLQMIASGDRFDEGAGRKVFRRYYNLFPKITKILPCWAVTSLSARGRLPFEPGFFDLVVIDEASQCDVASALPLLLRARRAVIIGDPLQLKHVSTVAPQQDRMMLSAHGLAEGNAAWAYSVNSLFDLARSLCRHEDIVNLRDHHRSHRDIIGFSNRHFYRGGLRIATDHDSLHRSEPAAPAVRWVDVTGRVMRPSRGGALNSAEAEAVVAELRRLVVEQGYAGAVGVVTPFRAQANRIRTLAHHDSELSGRLAALDFVVDTVHGFQGDERDVMFFSPVVSMGIGESTLRFLKNHGNLFNVAITRARSELIVVGDRQASLDSEVGYLASFAEYAKGLGPCGARGAPAAGNGPEYPALANPELVSEWERVFYKALYAAGLRPVPQYEESPYTLDFALLDGERKLDIEVDGENYHRNWDGEVCRRDQIRSRRLADLGWDVMRFWVYELRDDMEGAVARVKAWTNHP